MAVGIHFGDSAGFTLEIYDEAIRRLEAAGAGAPVGRVSHAAMENGDLINVFDIWDSMESFEAFGAILVPILGELGAAPADPMVLPVRNVM
jgi:hypothetical protein